MEFIQQNLYLFAIALISGSGLLFLTLRNPGGGNALSTTQATLLINRENAVAIDVSEPGEYENGHLPDSPNIPSGQLEGRVSELQKFKDVPLILVCQTGDRSSAAVKKLTTLGFDKDKVFTLSGGISAWRAAGLPVKKGSKK